MNKIIKVLFIFIIVFTCLSNLAFSQTGPRVYEDGGSFSYCPPVGWRAAEFPGLKYKIVFGPTEDRFATNIVFVDEIFNGNLHDYVNGSLAQLENFFQNYKLISREVFVTNSDIKGERIINTHYQNNFDIKQVIYILQASNSRYYVITCSVLDASSEKYLSVFDESIKTFEFAN